jgi:hypothetical protein
MTDRGSCPEKNPLLMEESTFLLPGVLPAIWRPIEQDLREVFSLLERSLRPTGRHLLKQLLNPSDNEYLLSPGLVLCSGCLFSKNKELYLLAVFMELTYLGVQFHNRAGDLGQRKEKQMLVLTGDFLSSHLFYLINQYKQQFLLETFALLITTMSEGFAIREAYKIKNKEPDKNESKEWLYKQYGVFYGESCALGGQFSGASEQEQLLLRDFGTVFGIAYGAYKNQCSLLSADEYFDKGLELLSLLPDSQKKFEMISFVQGVFSNNSEKESSAEYNDSEGDHDYGLQRST